VRTLDAGQITATDGPVTEPQYLVDIELDIPLFLSSRADVGGYTAGLLRMGRVAPDSVELLIENYDYRHTTNAQDGVYLRKPVKIWWAYGDETRILMFDGVVFGTPMISEWLSVTVRREPPRLYPFTKLRQPLANFLPSAGYVIQFDGQVLKIEGR